MSGDDVSSLLVEAQHVLRMNQAEFGALFGVSRRSIIRWQGGAGAGPEQLELLAREVYPEDAALAARIAIAAGTTVERLGLAPVALQLAPPRAPPSGYHLVDSIVCAAAEAAGAMPQAMRPALLAAFERAANLSLGVEEVLEGLRAPRS
jgi:hypothetical protein